jgi:hypothetical protein
LRSYSMYLPGEMKNDLFTAVLESLPLVVPRHNAVSVCALLRADIQ